MKLVDLAQKLNFTMLPRSENLDPDSHEVHQLNSLENAQPGEITFVNQKSFLPLAKKTKASFLLVREFLDWDQVSQSVLWQLSHENPYISMAKIANFFLKKPFLSKGIHELSFVDPTAEIQGSVSIYPFAYVGPRSKIGENSTLYPHVYVGEGVVLGKNCSLGPGTVILEKSVIGDDFVSQGNCVIGSEGFGVIRDGNEILKVPQVGGVVIGKGVGIGSCSTVDRATFESTTLDDGCQLDNHVQIGHNVVIGENSILCAKTGIAGSTKIGKNFVAGGACRISDHLVIEENTTLHPCSVVLQNVKDKNQSLGGFPAVSATRWKKQIIILKQLEELRKKILNLEKKLS